LNIAVETTIALVFLHNSSITHCDMKGSNILLDENFTFKVADFRLILDSHGLTHSNEFHIP